MNKETVLAIIAGVLIGVIFAFGGWKLSKKISNSKQFKSSQPIEQKTPKNQASLKLSISNLKDYDVISSDKFILSGVAQPNSNIIILTLDKDYFLRVKNDGSFEVEVELPPALSEIKVINLSEQQILSEQKIKLVYSTEFIKNISDNELSKKALAYVGTITDISNENIQIKNSGGEIQQITLVNETVIINTLKKNIEVKVADLAIGDYIIAMGFIENKGSTSNGKVLDSKRILVTIPITENVFEAKLIKIEKISKTKINDITLPKKWNGPDIKELEEGQEIIATGKTEKDIFSLRSIFIPVE